MCLWRNPSCSNWRASSVELIFTSRKPTIVMENGCIYKIMGVHYYQRYKITLLKSKCMGYTQVSKHVIIVLKHVIVLQCSSFFTFDISIPMAIITEFETWTWLVRKLITKEIKYEFIVNFSKWHPEGEAKTTILSINIYDMVFMYCEVFKHTSTNTASCKEKKGGKERGKKGGVSSFKLLSQVHEYRYIYVHLFVHVGNV